MPDRLRTPGVPERSLRRVRRRARSWRRDGGQIPPRVVFPTCWRGIVAMQPVSVAPVVRPTRPAGGANGTSVNRPLDVGIRLRPRYRHCPDQPVAPAVRTSPGATPERNARRLHQDRANDDWQAVSSAGSIEHRERSNSARSKRYQDPSKTVRNDRGPDVTIGVIFASDPPATTRYTRIRGRTKRATSELKRQPPPESVVPRTTRLSTNILANSTIPSKLKCYRRG